MEHDRWAQRADFWTQIAAWLDRQQAAGIVVEGKEVVLQQDRHQPGRVRVRLVPARHTKPLCV